MTRLLWLTAAAISLGASVVQAARPMTTDDAAITEAGQCGLQAWGEWSRHGHEGWLLPTCTLLAPVEVTAGGARHEGDGGSYTLAAVQLKTLLREQAPGRWGTALSLGWDRTARASHAETDRVDARALTAMTSYRAPDDGFLMHLNLGVRHDRVSADAQVTWGAAFERAIAARFGQFVEAFGESHGPATLQAGLRYDLVPQRVSVNCSVAARWRGGLREPFVTFGLNI